MTKGMDVGLKLGLTRSREPDMLTENTPLVSSLTLSGADFVTY
jgi:hypothetical protein